MPRDPSGNYTLPALGNPAVTATPITIAWWNGTSTDMASAFTDSLSRSGLGGMLVPFTLVDGTVTTPGFAFVAEPNTGIYRAGAFDARFAVGGTDTFKWTSTAVVGLLPFSVTATGANNAISGTGGTGATSGVAGTAGSASGFGVGGVGVGGGLGGYFLSSAANVNAVKVDGYISLAAATNPGVSTAFTNQITPKNVAKAWAILHTDGAGNITASNGFNISGATVSGSTATVNFASNFSATTYAIVATAGASSVGQPAVVLNTRAVGSCTFKVWDMNAAALYNLGTVSMDIAIAVYGAQ